MADGSDRRPGGSSPCDGCDCVDGGRDEAGFLIVTRRRLLNLFLAASGTAVGAAILYPVLRYLIPPPAEEAATAQVTLDFGPEELPANSGRIFRFGSRPGIVVRTPAGELRAFNATCTHLDCTVQYRDDISHIWCACHNGHYDLQGENIKGPPPRPLQQFAVKVADGEIVVSREA